MSNPSEYIPGTCNIGPEEIKQRRKGTIFSAILTISVIALLLIIGANKIWRLALFIPATSLAVGFQQTYYKFCVGFGMKGVFNFVEIGKMVPVEQKENLRKDQIKARKMIITGVVFGLIIAILFYLLPI